MLLVIDVTTSNVVTPDIEDKRGKPSTGVRRKSREVRQSAKLQGLCYAVGMLFLLVSRLGGEKVLGTL